MALREFTLGSVRVLLFLVCTGKDFADSLSASAAVMAYAWNFPDGLCRGPLAYYMGAPLILTGPKLVSGKPTKSEAEATYEASIYVKNNDISGGIALGGTGALSDKTVRYAFRQSSSAMIKGERYQ